MTIKKFDGKFLGNLGELFGHDSKIEIDELDCWWNHSRNILLEINNNHRISCSQNLSDLIRKNHWDENTDELKKFSVYEFEDGGRYVTHLVDSNAKKKLLKEREKVLLERMILTEEYLGALKNIKANFDFEEAEKQFNIKNNEIQIKLDGINKKIENL